MRELKPLLESKLFEIGKVLEEEYRKEMHVGTLDGLGGISLFFFHLKDYSKNEKYSEIGFVILSEIVTNQC